mmetsp:Transcript_9982/g.17991  ORF Transcript_9982/g.17991 Transcript_9982/m.17991 type:complete len:93 (+) Transcript_9982:473-751(+)
MYVMGADGQPTPLKVSAEEHTIAAAGSKLAQLKLWVGDLPAFARLQLGPQQPGDRPRRPPTRYILISMRGTFLINAFRCDDYCACIFIFFID